MKVLVIGNGLIGKGVVKALKKYDHEVIVASKSSGDIQVDLCVHESIHAMYQKIPHLDAVISTVGSIAKWGKPDEISREEFEKGFSLKGFGQIDLVLTGQQFVKPGGSFTLTTGILNTHFAPGFSCTASMNSAIESFVKSASLEIGNNLRLNAVSPGLVEEATPKIGDYFKGFRTVSLEEAAKGYIQSLEGILNGEIIKVWP